MFKVTYHVGILIPDPSTNSESFRLSRLETGVQIDVTLNIHQKSNVTIHHAKVKRPMLFEAGLGPLLVIAHGADRWLLPHLRKRCRRPPVSPSGHVCDTFTSTYSKLRHLAR